MSQIIRSTTAQSSAQDGPQLPARPCLPPRPKQPMESKYEEQKISPPTSLPIQPMQILQPTPIETYQATSAIYEEIKDDIVSFFQH